MTTAADPREGRSTRAVVLAAVTVAVPILLVSWTVWQVLEGRQTTLAGPEFARWAAFTGGGAALAALVGAAFWRSSTARGGVVLGVIVAGVAVACGLLTDIATSGGFA